MRKRRYRCDERVLETELKTKKPSSSMILFAIVFAIFKLLSGNQAKPLIIVSGVFFRWLTTDECSLTFVEWVILFPTVHSSQIRLP